MRRAYIEDMLRIYARLVEERSSARLYTFICRGVYILFQNRILENRLILKKASIRNNVDIYERFMEKYVLFACFVAY